MNLLHTTSSNKNRFENELISSRNLILEKTIRVFEGKAVEGHISGSLARGDSDAYSDIDIWFTFKDQEFDKIKEERLRYYNLIGEIVHICEPPQNAPINGIHSALIIKNDESLIIVDLYLCPLANSFITSESKKLFGLDLPLGNMELNPQKIKVSKDYRIDFLICFIFNTIKKIERNVEYPLNDVILQYNNLSKNYNFKIEQIKDNEQSFDMLQIIIDNIKNIANERQKKTLTLIYNFAQSIQDLK